MPAIASALVALVLYAVTLGGTYVYDDIPIVRDDPRVHQVSQWGKIWTTDYFNGGMDNLYRPIVSASYAIEWWLHGDRAWVFHLVNVLLHAGVAAAVAELTRRGLAGANRRRDALSAAYIAGLLFAAHPLHTEAVANIVGRAELACTLGILLALIVFAHRPLTTSRVVVVVLLGIFALLCKEQGILQPLILLLFGGLVWRNLAVSKSSQEGAALKLLVLITCWAWAGYMIGREHFLRFEWDRAYLDPTFQPMIHSVGMDHVLMPLVLVGRYTALMLWPAHMSVDYGGDVIGSHVQWADPYLWAGVAAVACWCAAIVIAAIRRSGFVLFCLISLAITYGLIGNIFTLIMTNFAERLMYLPSVFVLMMAGVLLTKLPVKSRIALLSAVLVLCGARTFLAARDWNDPLQMYEKQLAQQPRSIQLHLLLAHEYEDHRNHAAALAVMRDACARYPNYWRAWMHRALIEMDGGDFATAQKHLDRARYLDAPPIILSAYGRLDEAKRR